MRLRVLDGLVNEISDAMVVAANNASGEQALEPDLVA
jgi:hypothetical protein